ncbi:MAG: 50S ribosomal protein L27 [Candidatus Pacebacteria bacterium]|nr:50S ribosomal protein L27 [Candidatus Paceibacterota bacterium]MDD4333573.1 50S ribosomal protein L27 [Candidatus Paceibacterota bacterium]
MSKTKASGTTKLGRDSQPQYLGVKLYDGEKVKTGNIIVRQRGTKFLMGDNVKLGKDHTIYAMKDGVVRFTTTRKKKFDGSQRIAKIVHVK